jgi:hypothetical protein
VVGFCEHGNEPSGYTKSGEFLDCLTDGQFLTKGAAAWSSFACVDYRPTHMLLNERVMVLSDDFIPIRREVIVA